MSEWLSLNSPRVLSVLGASAVNIFRILSTAATPSTQNSLREQTKLGQERHVLENHRTFCCVVKWLHVYL